MSLPAPSADIPTVGIAGGRGLWSPSLPDLLFIAVLLTLSFGAPQAMTQSDGDLFAHIRMGLGILGDHAVPRMSELGLASSGAPMTSPAWLSEVLFAGAWRTGGLALVVVIAAAAIAGAHATVAWLLRARGADLRWVTVGALVSVALGSSHWLARPHAFSLLAAALLIVLLEQDDARRLFAAAPLMALWVNLHGAWVYGVVIMVLHTLGRAIDARRGAGDPDARRDPGIRWMALAAAAAATLLNPYGLALHRDVLASLSDPTLATYIDEYRAPGYRQLGDQLFLATALATLVIFARGRAAVRMSSLFVVVATLAAACMAGRNIALFSVTGWPLVALYAASEHARRQEPSSFTEFSRRESRAVVGSWGAPTVVALLAFGILGGSFGGRQIIAADVNPARFPVAGIAELRNASTPVPSSERIFAPWDWGGYLAFVWPRHRAFIDPLKFSADGVAAYGDILLARGGWERELDQWKITTVITPTHGRLADGLAQRPGWTLRHADATAAIFQRTAR